MASPEAGKAIPPADLDRPLHTAYVETHARVDFKDITDLVQKVVTESGVQSGICFLFVPHTTAAILINENDDPALQKDLDQFPEIVGATGQQLSPQRWQLRRAPEGGIDWEFEIVARRRWPPGPRTMARYLSVRF